MQQDIKDPENDPLKKRKKDARHKNRQFENHPLFNVQGRKKQDVTMQQTFWEHFKKKKKPKEQKKGEKARLNNATGISKCAHS